MKIAVFHNFMDNIGGAERVGLILAKELQADFYTTNIDRDKIQKMGFLDINLYSIGKVPINAPFRQQVALHRFRNLNLKKKYDFYIIDGDWAVSGAVNNKPNLWYVHSPIREIWDLYRYTRQKTVPRLLRPAFDAWVFYNRHLNRTYIKHVHTIVCNAANTKNRLKKYLYRDSVVIHPPIETSQFHHQEADNYWLSVNRLITHKRIEMQLEAFANLPDEKLIIVGCYEQSRHFKDYARRIQSLKPKNVEMRSWVDQQELINLYANSTGLITTSVEEDFGMAPVEAMSSGKPVIAPNEGGYKETIINGITGILIDDINAARLTEAIKKINKNHPNYKDACLEHARKFDTKFFVEKIKEHIHKTLF